MDISKSLLANSKYRELIKLTQDNDEAHDLAHFQRVTKYALEIGRVEKADLEVLEAAGMLHDIARGLETTGKIEDHLPEGAKISGEILFQINFSKDKIDAVAYCVSVHQRRAGIEPKTLESKIIQDADLVDTYGLIYAARSILWGVQSEKYKRPLFIDEHIEDFDKSRDKNRSTIHYLYYRLIDSFYSPDTLHTETARKMAKQKMSLLKDFVDNFIKEWRGEI